MTETIWVQVPAAWAMASGGYTFLAAPGRPGTVGPVLAMAADDPQPQASATRHPLAEVMASLELHLTGRDTGQAEMAAVCEAFVLAAHERAEKAVAEREQLAYERRLLGAARMVLDLVAADDATRWDQVRTEASDLAQRIVDEIGHPATHEPELGPSLRDEVIQLKATIDRAQEVVRVWSRNCLEPQTGRLLDEARAALGQAGEPQ